MRVGIDARTLSGRYTGDRTYWRGLIGGLAEADKENKYILYLRQPLDGEPPLVGPNFQWRTISEQESDTAWMLRQFPRALEEDGIDVGHTQYNIPLLGAPCPIVTTVHDVTFALFPQWFAPRDRWILSTLVPRSMRRAAHVIADSESTRRDILRLYGKRVPAAKVTKILLAPDPFFCPPFMGQESARAMANAKHGIGGRPYVLAVGVLQPRKNLSLLLKAFTVWKSESRLPHRLVITGKRGWKNEDLDHTWETLPEEIRREIVFTGYVADGDLPELYGGAEALCYPSLYEGFGLPPLEAMACGCPVLCSDTSSLPEVVGDAAVLLPPNDAAAWTNALQTLLTDNAKRVRLRVLGIARSTEFSWARAAHETLDVYRKVYQK